MTLPHHQKMASKPWWASPTFVTALAMIGFTVAGYFLKRDIDEALEAEVTDLAVKIVDAIGAALIAYRRATPRTQKAERLTLWKRREK